MEVSRSLWDVERKRWPFHRKQIDEGLTRCGLSDDPAFRRKIEELDEEWELACELREVFTARDRSPAVNRVVLLPLCRVEVDGYVPFSRAMYWMAPKEVSGSTVGIIIGNWEQACTTLVSWIGSGKVALVGRRPGSGKNELLPAETLANHAVVDVTFEWSGELDGSLKHLSAPWPDTSFLQCCFSPDDEHWQREAGFTDQFFNAKHRVEWTHLQVNMAEVIAASKLLAQQREALSDAEGVTAPSPKTVEDQATIQRERKSKDAPKRGPIRASILNDLENGKTTPERLDALPQKALLDLYGSGAARTTVSRCHERSLSRFPIATTRDKRQIVTITRSP
jgi:hypothetical protein